MNENPERHPSLAGLNKRRGVTATCLVIFGASGDLTSRKLLPALYNLGVDNLLPSEFALIGFGRKPLPDDEFRELAAKEIAQHSRRAFQPENWNRVGENTFYQAGDYDDPAAYEALKTRIEDVEKKLGHALQTVFYISTPPTVFQPILENLGACGLAARGQGTATESKVIIEKPFGRDLQSAVTLNRIITRHFQECQVFRIDHYLGKETVQNLLVLRFANSIFEPIWKRNYVDNVQITVAEELGVGTRGGYYDQSGSTRDMIQNHTMQLLALTAMEPPVTLDAEDIRNEKVKLLKAIQPIRLDADGGDTVRGQYTDGLIYGEKVTGYLKEKNIAPDSTTETFSAIRLNINNWRWAGVPFYLRSGKRMARRVSEIAVQFKPAAGGLFSSDERYELVPNRLVIQIQPDEGVTFATNSKVPGLDARTQPVEMNFRYATTYGSNTPEAYERLILDCMTGDRTLFIRGDETESSWKIYTPLLDFWKNLGRRGLETYTAGSWGPTAADHLLWNLGHSWRNSEK